MILRRWLAHLTPLRFTYYLMTRPRRTLAELVRRVKNDGVFRSEAELYMASLEPKALWDEVLRRYAPKTVLDVGCGVGRSIDYFVDHGVDAVGIEASELAIRRSRHPERIVLFDLREGPYYHPRSPVDLVWCYEVAEHIPAQYVDHLLETLCLAGARILLSTAQPGQGGVGHLNEQPLSYWRARLERCGFALDQEGTLAFQALPDRWAGNLQIFERASAQFGGD